MKIAISGIRGRMGEYVYKILRNRFGYDVVCGISRTNKKYIDLQIYATLEEALNHHEIDLLIDFTNGEAFYQLSKTALENKIKVLSGTTGIKNGDLEKLINLSQKNETSFVYVPNFAKGASEMYRILESINDNYEKIDLVEVHHKRKLDRPSGTAIEYANLLDIPKEKVESLRLNEVIASHEAILTYPGEKLIIRHEINHRDAFLNGFLTSLEKLKNEEYFMHVGLKNFYKIEE